MSDSKTDVDELIRLALWARDKGFRIGPTVQLGSLQLGIEDLRLDSLESLKPREYKRGVEEIWKDAGLDAAPSSEDGTIG